MKKYINLLIDVMKSNLKWEEIDKYLKEISQIFFIDFGLFQFARFSTTF